MPNGLLSRVRRAILPRTATPQQHEQTAATARQDRAEIVSALWDDIRRLQREIKDVSDTQAGATAGDAGSSLGGRLEALEAELERTQQTLSRLQGRV